MKPKRASVILLSALSLLAAVSCAGRETGLITESTEAGLVSQQIESYASPDGAHIEVRELDAGEPGIYPALENYLGELKWGYIDSRGSFVIEPVFSEARRFQPNQRAIVGVNGKYGIIDTSGKYIAEPIYDNINEYSEKLAIARVGDGFVVLDEGGNIISEKYYYIRGYKNSRAVFSIMNQEGAELYGYLDETGKPVVEPVYKSVTDFDEEQAAVKQADGTFALIDKDGNLIRTLEYNYVGGFSSGMARFAGEEEGKYGYLDKNGNVAIPPSFTYAGDFRGDLAVVDVSWEYPGEKVGLIDKTGKFVIPPQYSEILLLGEGMAALGIPKIADNPFAGSKFALATDKGKIMTDFIFYSIEPFKNGVACASDSISTFFIDKKGKRIETLPSVEGTGRMELLNGLVYADIDNREFYMNEQGSVIHRPLCCVVIESGIRVNEEKFRPNKDYIVYYPVLSNMENPGIEEKVNSRLRDLWTDILTIDVKPTDDLDYSYTCGFSIAWSRKDLLVLKKSGYNYSFGAAHGTPVVEYVHINTRTGSFYKLQDLFKKGSDYVGILSEIVGAKIRAKVESDQDGTFLWPDMYEGIKPDQPFYLSGNSLNIYFGLYEIAPYAAGFPEFSVSFEEISDIIDKDGDFWRSFNNDQ
ncbi:MAG: WG repeat-containing protein [Bacillota bacterium]